VWFLCVENVSRRNKHPQLQRKGIMKATIDSTSQTVSQILREGAIPISEAQEEFFKAFNRKIDRVTLYRWCKQGVGGVKLEHIRLGHVIYTSLPSLTRFVVARSS